MGAGRDGRDMEQALSSRVHASRILYGRLLDFFVEDCRGRRILAAARPHGGMGGGWGYLDIVAAGLAACIASQADTPKPPAAGRLDVSVTIDWSSKTVTVELDARNTSIDSLDLSGCILYHLLSSMGFRFRIVRREAEAARLPTAR